MNPDVQTPHETTYGLVPVFSRRTFPPAPFPRAYVHAVIDDLSDAVRAVHALRADSTDARDIHVMACWDVVEAVERRWQQQGHLSRLFVRLHTFLDEGLGDVYLQEALRGHHLILVRLHSNKRMEQVREMLARHGAHQMKYVNIWVVRDLSSAPRGTLASISSE